MKKRILLSIAVVVALAIGVVGMSAFEAHVINVTAKIENALSVPVDPITFGTVFPQEHLNRPLDIALSSSFIDEGRVDNVNYVIKQKIKPVPITAPTIDGIVQTGEWADAKPIAVASVMGTVSVMADINYLYVLLDINDSTDARLGQNLVGNDQVGLNINPTNGGAWGFPYDIIFQTGADPAAWGGTSSGDSDGWKTQWSIKVGGVTTQQLSLPVGLKTMTFYGGGRRISEWKIPLSSINPEPGDMLKLGGAIDVGDGSSYVYPIGLAWADASTFFDYTIPVYPSLCPYLSKTPDGTPANDTGVLAFHNPSAEAIGYLSKLDSDIADNWTIDLAVPCFEGMCAPDWAAFVTGINPAANPNDFVLPANMEHETFGCDLWVEVNGIDESS